MNKHSNWFPVLMCLVLVFSACAPASQTPPVTPSTRNLELEDQFDEYLSRLSALGFRGSVLVAQNGEILLSKGYGALNKEESAPITSETLFAIGSNTKPFTAAAILKLQDQGLLNVNDPISRFIKDIPTDKENITLHQLLTHSAGLDHSGVFQGDFENVARDEAVERILASKLLFQPGTESSYSDYGFILLAAITELASGKSYQEYLRSELFEPAEMSHTGWWGNDPVLKEEPIATGYSEDRALRSLTTLPGPFWGIMGAGGMVSTVADLFRWHLALQEGKILSEESLEAYSSVQFRLDERGGEGYGWVVVDEPGRRFRASAGGNEEIGHNNVMRWQMDDDILLIASSSNDRIKAEDIVPNLARIALDRPFQMPPKIVAVEPTILDGYAGRYALTNDNALIVTRNGNELLLTGEGQAAFDLLFENQAAIDVESTQAAVINYLNSSVDPQLQRWKTRTAQTLGEFKEFKVIGTAAPHGNGEPWTYVSFEFERGNALTRWIVSPAGALQAAVLETEPPYVVFVPQSENQFVPFSLISQPSIQNITFPNREAEPLKMTISLATGQVEAQKVSSKSQPES